MKANEIEELINKKLGIKLANQQARTSVKLKPYLKSYKLIDSNISYQDKCNVEHAVVKAV